MKTPIPLIAVSSVLTAILPLHADTFGSGANEFTMDFVDIGNAGNAADNTGYGAVGYNYQMGAYEVNEGMISSYNAANPSLLITMDQNPRGVNKPATSVNWNEAARFVNWLNASQGHAAAYKFTTSGANDHIALWTAGDAGYDASNPFRNSEAHYFLPSQNEWYKSAYYDPDKNGGTGGYWDYATGSDTVPTATYGGTADETAVYRDGVNASPLAPADITNAGGLSPYGTMAQNGNVWEWMESGATAPNDLADEARVIRGGYWISNSTQILWSYHKTPSPTSTYYAYGFRVAAVSEFPPITGFYVIGGVDSGGKTTRVGTLTNHGSIGGGFATGSVDAGAVIIRSGLIEVLYAGAAPYVEDGDENGLPDAWEREHFGYTGVDPQGDADGDADTNLTEFLAGTNPKDIESHFKPKGTHDGAIHAIPIQTIVDRKYEVFVSRNMTDWYLQETYTGDGTQKVFNFDETTLPTGPLHSAKHPSKYFFRVKITEL